MSIVPFVSPGNKEVLTYECSDWESEIQVVDQKSVPDAWTQARDLILSSKDISEEERDLLRAGSLKTVTRDLEELDAQHTKASKFRRFAAKIRLKPLLDGLVNLDTIISPVTELDPYHIAPLVWGGIRLVILVLPPADIRPFPL